MGFKQDFYAPCARQAVSSVNRASSEGEQVEIEGVM